MLLLKEIQDRVADFLKRTPSQVAQGANFDLGSGGVPANLKELLEATAGSALGDIELIIPTDFLQTVQLTQCLVTPQAQIILGATFSPASAGKPSTFLPDFFSTTEFTALITLDPNALAGSDLDSGFEAILDAKIQLTTLELDAIFGVPGLDVSADAIFAEGRRPSASALFEKLSVNGGGFERLKLRQVSVGGSLRSKAFDFELILDEVFTQDSFTVKEATLSLSYVGGPDGEVTGSIAAKATLGTGVADQILFDVSAQYDGADFGWTFSGSAKDVNVAEILEKFGASDSPFDDLQVEKVDLTFNTLRKAFDFSFTGKFPTTAQETVQMVAKVHLERQEGGGFEKSFSGTVTIGPVEFDLVFDQKEGTTLGVGLYRNLDGRSINVVELVKEVIPGFGSLDKVGLLVKDALFAFQKKGGVNSFLFVLDTDVNIDLSGLGDLPLIGTAFPPGQALDVSVAAFVKKEVSENTFDLPKLTALLPAGSPKLPDKFTSEFGLVTRVRFGDFSTEVDLGINEADVKKSAAPPIEGKIGASSANTSRALTTTDTAQPAPNPDDIKWVDVQKNFGPLHVQKVGLGFKDGTVSVLLEAELSVSGLTLSVEGLGATYNIRDRELGFALKGLGIDFRKGDLEIGGGFLNLDGDFAGKLTIKTKTFSISALGAVAIVGGEPSIFIYGLLNYPLGGPAFFYVEGLAAGFGYNRSFKMPAIEAVRQFPLVIDAIDTVKAANQVNDVKNEAVTNGASSVAGDKAAIAAQLARLHEFIAPSLGEYFFAVGIKFSSFKLVNSFVLIAIVAGKKFELDLIGVSTYQNPPVLVGDLPALARIELNIIGRLAPEEGFVGIQGRLTDNSYVYSNLCKISGGFAFFSWFDGPHKGDFVLSIGGYHPSFVKPAHYPDVPRIALTYQITPTMYIKGSAYFALTPSVLMAGAAIEAHAEIGSVAAWFSGSIDFIITWEPYHYDAHLHVAIGARWWIFETEASADVEIWGPPFTGRANVTWTIFSFTVEFGDSTIRGPLPISFEDFQEKFIPDKEKVASVRVVRGVRNTLTVGTQEVSVIDTADFVLEVRSTVPAKSGICFTKADGVATEIPLALPTIAVGPTFGIAPMDLTAVTSSELQIKIKRDNEFLSDLSNLNFVAVEQNFPTGMWGKTLRVAATEGVIPALAGYTISPTLAKPSQSTGIPRRDFAFTDPFPNEFRPTAGQAAHLSYAAASNLRLKDVLQSTVTTERRSDLLKALGIDAAGVVRLSDSLPDSFLKDAQAPKVAVVPEPQTV